MLFVRKLNNKKVVLFAYEKWSNSINKQTFHVQQYDNDNKFNKYKHV